MEKQRTNTTRRFIKGLLVSLFILISFPLSLFADDYFFSPKENQKLITQSDITFELLIPETSSSEVTILEDMNQKRGERNVSFLSLKKYDDPLFDGTKIEISYNFEKKGEYSLLPLIVDIKGKTVKIEFSPIKVANNPLKMVPSLVIVFSNGKKVDSEDTSITSPLFSYHANEKLNFTVYLQYASKLNSFNYDIPQDSIYTETKTYEITNKEAFVNTISDDLIPIADFQWTMLKAGNYSLPRFKVNALGYDGKNYDITLPDLTISFLSKPLKNSVTSSNNDDSFSDAFSVVDDAKEEKEVNVTIKDCEKLASLYSKERNSIFSYFSAKKERIAFEESLNISSTFSSFPPVFYLYISILLIIIFALLLFFSLRKKYFFKTIAFSVLSLLSIACLIFTISKRSTEYGISKGCTVYSIPETSAEASCEIKAGSLVQVTETTDIWYHIQQGDANGWSLKDNIIIVK